MTDGCHCLVCTGTVHINAFYLQSHLGDQGKRRGMVRTTVLLNGRIWRETSRRAVTWSTGSTTETFMAPRSTRFMKWWLRAAPASWMLILRLVTDTHRVVCVHLLGRDLMSRLGPESVEDCWVYAICGVYCCSWTGHIKSYAQSRGRCRTHDQATHGMLSKVLRFYIRRSDDWPLVTCWLSLTGKWFEEDCGRECQDPSGIQPLLWPDYCQWQPGQGLWQTAGGCRAVTRRTTVGSSQLGLLMLYLWSDRGGL